MKIPTLYQLKTVIVRNHNRHLLVALKRGRHTVRLQFAPIDGSNSTGTNERNEGKASLWVSTEGLPSLLPELEGMAASEATTNEGNEGMQSPTPLTIRFTATYSEALARLAQLELAVHRQEQADIERLERKAANNEEDSSIIDWNARPVHIANRSPAKARLIPGTRFNEGTLGKLVGAA